MKDEPNNNKTTTDTMTKTTMDSTSEHRLQKSQSSALPSTSNDAIINHSSNTDETVGSLFSYSDKLLEPYMGLLPVSRPDDPWIYKPYDSHYALYKGGGSYEAYLQDARKRRDTHIMSRTNNNMLTPDMLERLLRIKVEFQRRFPHLYKNMLNHHTNQTRVEVKPPLLGPIKSSKQSEEQEQESEQEQEEPQQLELGAAERSPFEPSVNNAAESTEQEQLENNKNQQLENVLDDDVMDYFHFDEYASADD